MKGRDLKTILVLFVLMVLLHLPAQGQGTEPNALCQQAGGETVTVSALPHEISSALNDEAAATQSDVGFTRLAMEPGRLIELDFNSDIDEAVFDPVLGVFDSGCNLLVFNDDDEAGGTYHSRIGMVTVPDDGVIIVAVTRYADFGFAGEAAPVGGSLPYTVVVAPSSFEGLLITGVTPCDVTVEDGGRCVFSAAVLNATNETFEGKFWAAAFAFLVNGNDSTFPVHGRHHVNLEPGASQEFEFRFRVGAGLAHYVCTDLYLGQRPTPFMNVVDNGHVFGFCLEEVYEEVFN